MPQAREVRDSVIRDWLSGKPRDTIAHDNMISTGAVTYRIKEIVFVLLLFPSRDNYSR